MPLDIVSGTEVQTQATGVKIDPSAFRRQAIAQGQLVSGAGQDVASLFSQVSNKLQDIQNIKHLAEADNAVIDFNEKQQEEVLKHPNPSEWSGIYKANFKQFQDGLMSNPTYGPDVRNQIRNMLERSQTATDINIRTAANKRNVTDTGRAILYGMSKAVNSLGEKDASEKYYAGLLEMKNTGIIDQAEYNQKIMEAPMVIGKGQLDQAVVNNPIEAWKKLQEKDKDGNPTWLPQFKGQNRISIENEARVKFINKQNLNQRDIPEDLSKMTSMTADGKIAYVQKKADNMDISPRYAETAIRAIKQQDKAFQTQIKNDLKASALMFIKPGNPDNDQIHKLLYDELGLIENPLEQAETAKFMDDLYNKAKQPSKEEATAQARAIRDNKTYLYTKAKRALEDPLILPLAIKEDEIPYNGVMDRLATIWNGQSKTIYRQGKFAGDYAALKKLYATNKEQFEADFGVGTTPTMISNAKKEHTDQLNDLIRTWADNPANANAAADRTKVDEFWKSINKNYMMEQTRQALGLKQAAAKVVRIENPDQIKDLPRGTKYEYQGTIITK